MEFDFIVKNFRDYLRFKEYLLSLAKEESIEYKERHRKIINTKKEIISLSMADIRKVAKKIAKNCANSFLDFSKDDTYEEILIQGLVITYIKDISTQMSLLNIWKNKIDCWAHCDSVVSSMKLFAKSKEKDKYFEQFYNYCFSEEEFTARFGIVTLMTYYLEEKYIDKIYDMCRKITNKAYYVQMAVAWLISYGFVKFKEKTYALLEEKILDKFTQNKSICKCRDSFRVLAEDKEKLVNYRIK